MSHNQGKAVNGVKSEKSPSKHVCPPGPHQHPHPAKPEAGDDSASEASHVDPLPENIHKRINALKNIHLDVQRIEQDMYGKLFLIEAEHHKKMATLLRKRAQIIAGTYEPTVQESEFSLKEGGDEKPETGPANDQKGVPDFWLDIFLHSAHTAQMLNEEDVEAIKFLVDVRCVYSEQPLGFTLEFEFKENPFFTNTVLTRSYVFGTEVSREEMYVSSGLAPKTTEGCQINWKEGKDTTKKEHITYQVRKKFFF
jgi:Nucleosome assembly protein (NAP)